MPQKIIIIGGGFGGVRAAKLLMKQASPDVSVMLISNQPEFLFTPRLIDLVAGSVGRNRAVRPLLSIFHGRVDLVLGSVTRIDLKQREVVVKDRAYAYDKLLIATGAKPNFYGLRAAAQHCLTFKTFRDMQKLQRAVRETFAKALQEPDETKKKQLLTFAIVGAGATGVELALALHERIQVYLKRHPELQAFVRIALVESGERILPILEPKFSRDAELALQRADVKVMLKRTVTDVAADALVLDKRSQLPAAVKVWVAGVEPLPIPTNPAAERRQNRFVVTDTLQLKGYSGAFAIGDCSYLEQNSRPLPQNAFVAWEQAVLAAQNILAGIRNQPLARFSFRPKGYFLFLGSRHGAVTVGKMHFRGFLAAKLRHLVYLLRFREIT